MKLRALVPLVIVALTLPGLVAATIIALRAVKATPPELELSARINPLVTIAFVLTVLVALAAWFLARRYLVEPLAGLAREAQRVSLNPRERGLAVANDGAIREIVAAVGELGRTLGAANAASDQRIEAATQQAQEQKRRLEAILLDLTEGVIVCNRDHRIILYNEAARRILGLRDVTGLGRSLFGVLAREPVMHTLDILMGEENARSGAAQRFMAATVDMGTLVETRMSLVREETGQPAGYVLTFQDISQQIESLAERDALLREVMMEWRRPVANLSAAIEMLTESGELGASERAGFEEILRKEIAVLTTRVTEAARRIDQLDLGHWGTADVHSTDLFRTVERLVAADPGVKVQLVGLPMWINADSHALTLAAAHLIRHVATAQRVETVDLGMARSGSHAYLEIAWAGSPVPLEDLDQWIDEPLKGTVAGRSVRQIIESHGGEVWSTAGADGGALLRLPLRASDRHQQRAAADSNATANTPRPEYYDFDLFRSAPSSLADARLKELRFVVFDTETTGLQPSQGDELISIGAVQVVNGRILTGETFERLIDPERDIPALSTRFHGITADMVVGKPPARIVLPQFRAFAGDAVLIAYNIAFDMTFLHKRQEEAGVVFDNPVLDALLLAIHVFPDHPDPSLSSMAEFLDIRVEGRHTALGDALMTAAVWVRLIEGLERRGVTTFGQAVEISDRMLKERRLKERF